MGAVCGVAMKNEYELDLSQVADLQDGKAHKRAKQGKEIVEQKYTWERRTKQILAALRSDRRE